MNKRMTPLIIEKGNINYRNAKKDKIKIMLQACISLICVHAIYK